MSVLTIVVLVFLGLIGFAIVCATYMLVFKAGRNSVQDSVMRCLVYITEYGHTRKPLRGKLAFSDVKGNLYEYGKHFSVIYPHKYERTFREGYLEIHISERGQMIANPPNESDKLQPEERSTLLYEVSRGRIGVEMLRFVTGSKNNSVLIVAILAFAIGALGVFGITQYQSNQHTANTANVTGVQQQSPSQQIQVTGGK